MPIAVARVKLHPRISRRRIIAQDRINEAHALEEVAPVERGEQAHTRDDVADGDLCCGLSLMLKMDELFGRAAALDQILLNTVEHGHDRRVLIAQPLNEMHDERAAWLSISLQMIGDDGNQLFDRPISHAQQLVCEHVGLFSLLT